VYYWYNFMPLARGSAAVGYTTILSLFWALGMPITVPIPKDYQTDWEAILCQVRCGCCLLHAQRVLWHACGAVMRMCGSGCGSIVCTLSPPLQHACSMMAPCCTACCNHAACMHQGVLGRCIRGATSTNALLACTRPHAPLPHTHAAWVRTHKCCNMQDPNDFVKEMRTWLLPPEAFREGGQGHADESVAAGYCDPRVSQTLPDVMGTLGTLRKRFYALNYGTDAEKLSSGRSLSAGGSTPSSKRRS
jgi:hypothetical protein